VHIGHERRRLLVARRDEADARPDERIHHVQVLFPGDSEDELDAFVFKTPDKQVGGFHTPLRRYGLI